MKTLLFAALFSFITFNSIAGDYKAKKVVTKPIIDGSSADACWSTVSWAPIDQLWVGTAANNSFTGKFKVTWDDSLVYILVEVMDNVFHDTHSNPLQNYWDDDCIEIFVDENKSGGDHLYNFNAFAYHVSPFGDVVDNNATTAALFNKHLKMDVDTNGNIYTWEVALKIYNDKFDETKLNLNRVNLTEGKIMGFSMAYNDSDNGTTRERMYGSQIIAGTDKNISYKTADAFGTLTLEANPLTFIEESLEDSKFIFYNEQTDELIINSNSETTDLFIYSQDGRLVKKINHIDSDNKQLNVNDLTKGIYIIKSLDKSGITKILKTAIW